ncbi:MAG: DAK2 domain-containing protein [Lachnospiraceae bacterium]|nr:DAK2 domain-containing protein [Lachnospiraceae bacterium]
MQSNKIDAATLSKMFLAGAKRLESCKDIINELNVFPVPDGDTGTNMSLTIMSAVGEVETITDMNMATLSKAISSGSLRGARGNSGVILSQLFRGFTKVIKENEELDTEVFTQALSKAVETAYKAVMKPKEGTILTVARGVAERAVTAKEESGDFDSYFKEIIFYAEEVLQKTPEMLPVLKEAGVVDSGGQGLLEILKGGYAAYSGEDADEIFEISKPSASPAAKEKIITYETSLTVAKKGTFGEDDGAKLKEYLDEYGTEAKMNDLGDRLSISVFTDEPGRIISKCLSFGTIDDVVIKPWDKDEIKPVLSSPKEPDEKRSETLQNDAGHMASEENVKAEDEKSGSGKSGSDTVKPENQKAEKKEPEKEMGFVAVSCGSGLDEIFKSLGVDHLITGGQTMNPSTDDMLNAIEKVNAKCVFILPNNKNIILAANQAQFLVEDKQVIVIPTKTIPQGITALITYMNDATPSDNETAMNDAISRVKTGQVTYAVRDTSIGGMQIQKGNIMGIGDHEILSVGTVVEDTAMEMLSKMVDDESEIICIYFGDEVDEEIANEFARCAEEKYPDLSVELHPGGQPIYYYIISVE